MKPRIHKNTPRLTAEERADAWIYVWAPEFGPDSVFPKGRAALIEAFSAHARETLARAKRRRAKVRTRPADT